MHRLKHASVNFAPCAGASRRSKSPYKSAAQAKLQATCLGAKKYAPFSGLIQSYLQHIESWYGYRYVPNLSTSNKVW